MTAIPLTLPISIVVTFWEVYGGLSGFEYDGTNTNRKEKRNHDSSTIVQPNNQFATIIYSNYTEQPRKILPLVDIGAFQALTSQRLRLLSYGPKRREQAEAF